MLDLSTETPSDPLGVEELIGCLRQRWRATYDLQLVVRRQRLYLQVMWAYLEQQSFPMDEVTYREHLAEVLDVVVGGRHHSLVPDRRGAGGIHREPQTRNSLSRFSAAGPSARS